MKSYSSLLAQVVIAITLTCLYSNAVNATTEYATFVSFYKEPAYLGYIGWIAAATIAILAGATIFFTGGMASPIVVSTGTWIGGMMGFHGIVATNAGLAMLGGGAIASGGFGIIGGVTLLTAVLSFSTEIVLNYTLTKATTEYNYNNLMQQSKEMVTLPLPINSYGPNFYKDAIDILDGIDKKSPIFSNSNQQIIGAAIKMVKSYQSISDEKDKLVQQTLLSLLYFVTNDYVEAKLHADQAIHHAQHLNVRRTLPAFIYATSFLYDKRFDFASITDKYFKYSILAEPDNQLITLLFSIYLDRMLLRFNDGFLDEKSFRQIYTIMGSSNLTDQSLQNYIILLSRYLIRLKIEQQKITSLSGTSNNLIKNSPKTVEVVSDSLNKYNALVAGAVIVMGNLFISSVNADDNSKAKITELHSLLLQYKKDGNRLASVVENLKTYQRSIVKDMQSNQNVTSLHTNVGFNTGFLFTIFILIIGVIIVIYSFRKANQREARHHVTTQ